MVNEMRNKLLDLFAKRCPSCRMKTSVLSLLLNKDTTKCQNCGVRISSSNERAVTITLITLFMFMGLPARASCKGNLWCLLVVMAIGMLILTPIFLYFLKLKVDGKNRKGVSRSRGQGKRDRKRGSRKTL
jgi:uncharacterized protein (DUF983 family)